MQPAITPGSESGSVIFHSVRHSPAPSAREASARFGSVFDITVRIGSTISGICTCASTMTTPSSVNRRRSGSLVSPSPMAIWFSTPCRPRMTIQENVRTTTLVMIGRITRNNSTVCQRALAREQIQAIG
jgi:hypothetical protein